MLSEKLDPSETESKDFESSDSSVIILILLGVNVVVDLDNNTKSYSTRLAFGASSYVEPVSAIASSS
ncbi:hypothetical protein C5L28_001570 [Lentilactobacillus parakefiri]|uniref:Uncharacterized protein n=1 Tax=Lentilactobacillus parakefiri TaxID=152332 RepID=A0A224V4S3_9LACO|nr:hypothetical protein C5L28_001570 [Lentilactobacillus parakefiri]GAW71967.1 hypothetical protein LPKJCM_01072 [Lentilactobacillus parakefiri]